MCLDSDFLIAVMRGERDAVRRAKEFDAEKVQKATTPVNVFELYLGAHLSKRRRENLDMVKDLLFSIKILDLDEESCEMAGGIAATLKKAGRPIGVRDSMIAGMARRFDQTLITRNAEHFSRVKGLKFNTW